MPSWGLQGGGQAGSVIGEGQVQRRRRAVTGRLGESNAQKRAPLCCTTFLFLSNRLAIQVRLAQGCWLGSRHYAAVAESNPWLALLPHHKGRSVRTCLEELQDEQVLLLVFLSRKE